MKLFHLCRLALDTVRNFVQMNTNRVILGSSDDHLEKITILKILLTRELKHGKYRKFLEISKHD